MSSSGTSKKAHEPVYDPPSQAEQQRFQAVLQALLAQRPRSAKGAGPDSAQLAQTGLAQTGLAQTGLAQTGLAQTGLGGTDTAHVDSALADPIHSVAVQISPANPAAVSEPSAVPRFQQTTVVSHRRRLWWILCAAVFGAVLLRFVWSGFNSGDVWERLIVAVLAILWFGMVYWVREHPRNATPEVTSQPPGKPTSTRWPPSPEVFPLRDLQAAPAAERPPASPMRRFLVAVLTLFPGVLVAIWNWREPILTWALLIVVAHELGHWWALRRVGARNTGILFFPLAGGVAIGDKPNATSSERVFVCLMGPAPGLMLGCLIYALDTWVPVPFWRQPAFILVILNLGNLLPIWPLDGGRIAWEFLARHSAWVQAIFSVCSLVGFVLLLSQTWGACVLVTFLYGLIVQGRIIYQEAAAAIAFQRGFPGALPPWNELSEQQLWNLYLLVEQQSQSPNSVKTTASLMRRVFDRAYAIPRSPAPAWALVAVGALYLLAAGTYLKTELASDWWKARAEILRQIEAQTSTPAPPEAPGTP